MECSALCYHPNHDAQNLQSAAGYVQGVTPNERPAKCACPRYLDRSVSSCLTVVHWGSMQQAFKEKCKRRRKQKQRKMQNRKKKDFFFSKQTNNKNPLKSTHQKQHTHTHTQNNNQPTNNNQTRQQQQNKNKKNFKITF